MLNIGEKCGSNRLELWVWNVKLSLFQVRTDVKKQVLTKLDAFRVFWQHLSCYIWKWHIGQFLNSATKKLYKLFLLNERACPRRGGGSSFARPWKYNYVGRMSPGRTMYPYIQDNKCNGHHHKYQKCTQLHNIRFHCNVLVDPYGNDIDCTNGHNLSNLNGACMNHMIVCSDLVRYMD